MRRLARTIIALVSGTVVGVMAVASMWVLRPYKGYDGPEQFVDVLPRTSVYAIGDQLIAAGVVRNQLAYRVALWWLPGEERLKAGEYRFDRALRPTEVVGKLERGDVYLISVTFREGLTTAEMARIFETRGFGPAQTFVAAAADAAPIAALDPDARDLEGYLFPDTYALPRKTDATRLVRRMTSRFEQVVTPEFGARAQARGLTVRQAVTLASLVEKETGKPEERPIVAAVYLNRLRIGMGLQCDPSVIYALQRAGRYDGNLTREDLAFDSPYNTYRYAGLPPGPIAAPGRASLEAVVDPAQVDYMYFVSRNDGSHVFAATLAEHNANVRQYQKKGIGDRGQHVDPLILRPTSPLILRPTSPDHPITRSPIFLSLSPFQFLSQDLEIAAGRGADKLHRPRPLHAHDIVRRERIAGLAIVGDEDLGVGVDEWLHPYFRRRGNDDGPVRQGMRRDRREDDRVDARMNDRAARREVVRRRSGGAGDDEAVGLEARDELVADRDRQIDDAGERALRDDDVVEHDAFDEWVAGPQHRRLQHQPFEHRRRSRERRLERVVQLGQRDFGEKPEAAEIDAENRDVDPRRCDPIGHAEQRPVTAEREDEIHFSRQNVLVERLAPRRKAGERRGLALEDRSHAAGIEPAGDLGEHAGGFAQAALGDDPDASDRHRQLVIW